MRKATVIGCVVTLCLVNAGCFEVVFDVTKRSALPGETIDVTATIITQESGRFMWTAPVYLQIPDSWTLVYVDTMYYRSNSYLGQTDTDFERGFDYQYGVLTDQNGTHCLDGVNYDPQQYVPRAGYKTYPLRFLSQLIAANSEGWVSIRARIVVDGEPGETYTIRAWGGTYDVPDFSNTERCALFEIPVKIALFADDFEQGDTSEWSVTAP